MKNTILAASAALLAAFALASCGESTDTTTTSSTDSSSMMAATPPPAPPADAAPMAALSTTDMYTDLKTGKAMHIKQAESADGRSGAWGYVWENDQPLEFYVNNTTHDAFSGATGQMVNNMLSYNQSTKLYSMRDMQVEQNGDGYKAKSADGDTKVKENSNELKVKDGDAKLKVNDNEIKYKDGDMKYKSNGDETKIKTKDQKIITKDGKTTVKPR